MSIQSRPNLIFDLDKAELRGLAHATCTNKAKLDWYASKSIEWNVELPSKEQIEFGCKIARIMQKTRECGRETDEFHIRILLYECLWKTCTAEQCLASERVNELINWWVSGSKIMSETRGVRIVHKIAEMLKKP